MSPLFRRRFGSLIDRQLDLFAADNAELLDRIGEAREAWAESDREESEERFGDYSDLVGEGTEILAELRDTYATTLDGPAAGEYKAAFDLAVLRRFGDLALELGDD